ncbi:MAG: hypothetical protein HY297_03800 [Thaumarchaeota archaeon]|nr:hypothetical protein [Nitrososphaerota archaeon]
MTNSILSLPDNDQPDLLGSLAQEFKEAFAELSGNAERELYGKNFVFSRYGRELYPYFEESDASLVPGCIIPVKQGRPVASVDSTSVLVGETSRGALYAARTAIGLSYEGSLRRFFRLGPILVYVSSSGVEGIKFAASSQELSMLLSDHAVAERVIRNAVERRVIEALMEGQEEAIVMADGSLRHPLGALTGSMPPSGKGGSRLVGFSKSSNLIFSEAAVGSLSKSELPSYFVIDEGQIDTVLAKFTPDGLVFRLDIPRGPESVATTLGRIMWNDAFASGYPDSLKIAHHLSVFSRADDQALKALVTQRFKLRQIPTFSLRRIALGSFKGGA